MRNLHGGLATLFKFMKKTNLPAKQCILLHEEDMNEYKKNNYIGLLKTFGEVKLAELYEKCMQLKE